MAELFQNLGIDWKLLVANTITFFLVLWILRKFAYRPIIGILEKRQQTVADSLDKAKQAEQAFTKFQQDKEVMLTDAKKQAQALMHEAEQQAESIRQQKLQQTNAEATALLDRTRDQLQRDQQQMLAEAKGKLADLVVAATGKVLEETVDAQTEKTMQAKAVKALEDIRA